MRTDLKKSLVDARTAEMIFANSSARRKRVRKQFDYEAQDESSNLNATEKFRAEFFFTVMDNAIASFTERFQQLTKFQDNFGFLFDIVSKRSTDALDDSAAEGTQPQVRESSVVTNTERHEQFRC